MFLIIRLAFIYRVLRPPMQMLFSDESVVFGKTDFWVQNFLHLGQKLKKQLARCGGAAKPVINGLAKTGIGNGGNSYLGNIGSINRMQHRKQIGRSFNQIA